MLLDGVIGQMDERLVYGLLAQGERVAAGADVAFAEQIASLVLQVATIYQHPETDVELPLVDKQRPLYVFLDDEDLRLDVCAEVGART